MEGSCEEMTKVEEGTTGNAVVRWERFLGRMVVRVLLVEADDSTRQIITALLQKCCYKVVAVSDGSKAWEVLKGRTHNIDLILTEVELPLVSGLSLLKLIAEDEICKKIPVIMMSEHDSVNTVYNCMLRGAADFLVKPIRKNELKNLWQHVWRRKASSGGHPQAASNAHPKVEAAAENNASDNHSSGYESCIQRSWECIEKGTDSQISWIKLELEAETESLEHRQDLIQSGRSKSLSSDMKTQEGEEGLKESECVLVNDSEPPGEVFYGSTAVSNKNANITTAGGDMAADNECERASVTTEAYDLDKNDVDVDSSREAADLIGSFKTFCRTCYISSDPDYGTAGVDSSSLLDLSLKFHPSGSANYVMNNMQRLKHSDASAFSRYIGKTVKPLHSASQSISNEQRGYKTNCDEKLSHQVLDNDPETRAPARSHDNNLISPTTDQPKMQLRCPQQGVFPVRVPVRSLRFESLCAAYGSVMPSLFSTQPVQTSLQSPGVSGHHEPSFQANQIYPFDPETTNTQKIQCPTDQDNDSDMMEHKKTYKLDPSKDRGHFIKVAVENGSKASGKNDVNCRRSIEREAALEKFRMKRKERCYEKKVRYENRRKLAEKRPRIKGQFVRHVQTEAPSVQTDDHFVSAC